MGNDSDLFALSMPAANHWHHIPVAIPYRQFGMGSHRPFSWYLEKESVVQVKNYREVCKWLAKCKYVEDSKLFGKADVWQHPSEFEKLKKGDCDDHALWAWRKLVELGLEAQFVCGSWHEPNKKRVRPTGHAWVIFKKKGKKSWHVLECTQKNPKLMLISTKVAEKNYFPELSVNGKFETFRFRIAKQKRY